MNLDERQLRALRQRDPALFAELSEFMSIVDERDEKRRCEDSLIEFFIAAWPHMGEAGELSINWHHERIAEALEAQAYGERQNLIINQPPRSSKTSLASIALPAWVWLQPESRWSYLMGPHVQFFCLSYGATLAYEIATKQRRLILSPWYQHHWGDRVKLRDDQSSRDNFATTSGGGRISNSIEGGILGRGGAWIICDDPHHIRGAESEIQRHETLDGMRALTTRVNDPRHCARTLIMQRLHEDDATNYALEHWFNPHHLMFPMRFESNRAIPEDPRTKDGELLWPEIWTERAVQTEERELGEYMAAGQLQQAPVPRGGGIIKREYWRLWPDDALHEAGYMAQYRCVCGWEHECPPAGAAVDCIMCGRPAERVINYPDTSFRILSVDTAYSEADQDKNSWNAATRWGIWHGPDESPRIMLMEAWRGRVPLRGGAANNKGLVEQVHEMAVRGRVDVVLIEKKTRGPDLYNELERLLQMPWRPSDDPIERAVAHVESEITRRQWRSRNPFATPTQKARQEFRESRYQPFSLDYFEPTGRGDKIARLMAVQGLFTNDLIWAPDKKWADMVIQEIQSQPRAQFSDLCDTATAALLYVRDKQLLRMSYEHAADLRRASLFRGNRENRSIAAQYEGPD